MSNNSVPADRSQLWTNTEFDPGESVTRFAVEAEQARTRMFGAEKGSFEERQAETSYFYSKTQHGTAAFQQIRHDQRGYEVKTHNEPYLAAIRDEEEKKTTKLMTDLMFGMAAVAGTSATLGAMGAGPEGMGTTPAPSPLLSTFQNTLLPRSTGMTSFEQTAADRFNALSANPVTAYGAAPSLTSVAPELATVMPITPAAAPMDPAGPGQADVMAEVAPSLTTSRPVTPRKSNALTLEYDLSQGPKPPTWVTKGSGSSSSAG